VTENFADRLVDAIARKKAPVTVGIDPVYDRLPATLVGQAGLNSGGDLESSLDAVLEFSRRVIRLVAPYVPAVKINSAYFERYLWEGIEGYYELIQEAAERELIVIADVKRGDVGHTAEMYAAAHLADPDLTGADDLVGPDAVTVSGYLGLDSLEPFLKVCREDAKGVFVLVRTSNPGAAEVQNATTADGLTVAEFMAQLVTRWAVQDGLVGQSGFSSVGAVVAPRDVEQAKRIRDILSSSILLVPGYGAQGLGPTEVAACFTAGGGGAIVNASRSVIYAYERPEYKEQFGDDWEPAVAKACQDFVAQIQQVAGIG
jgi:orotidine-5'-phosphate decarboxylase